MQSLNDVQELVRQGAFREAFDLLSAISVPQSSRLEAELLRSDLLERTGQYDEAQRRILALLKRTDLTDYQLSACHLALGRISDVAGDLVNAALQLQRALAIASVAKEHELVAWAQYRLLRLLFDTAGPEATGPLLAEVRLNAARCENPHVLAAVHLNVAEMECKRGSISNAERHILSALKILDSRPNKWLRAMAESHIAAVCYLRLDIPGGMHHAHIANQLADDAGWAIGYTATLATISNLAYHAGDMEKAAEFCKRTLSRLTVSSDNFNSMLETLACIRLAQGRTQECDAILRQIEQCAAVSASVACRYGYRHALVTRAKLQLRLGSYGDARETLKKALTVATRVGDELLLSSILLTKASLHVTLGEMDEVADLLGTLSDLLIRQPPHKMAEYEHVLASALFAIGERSAAEGHLRRATTIFVALGNRQALAEVSVDNALDVCIGPSDLHTAGSDARLGSACSHTLQNIASLCLHWDRPLIVAKGISEVIESAGCAKSVTTVVRSTSNGSQPPREAKPNDSAAELTFRIGLERDEQVEVIVEPKPDIEAVATLNALGMLLFTLRDCQSARQERDDRSLLWPINDHIGSFPGSVVVGHMREVMALAQRVARTKVNILITGESGTGKEIIARAVHDYSDRAQKPFVPFNCSAVPRDLVESQLFGYRRGAFTGADRDYAGLIRGARDGTLFLDEVGDLALDLQPKLLRFLESGEISPLGELSPINVNVRVVAATNSNLEEAVREGRFREDLFYRLNVVRLSLRPLRERRDEVPGLVTHFVERAAQEFNKGRLDIAEETMERLLLYRWPGNVRQLQNEMRRMVALAEPHSTLQPWMISDDIIRAMPMLRAPSANGAEMAVRLDDKLLPTLARVEFEMVKTAIHNTQGKMDAAARALGISRKGLYLKRQRLGL